MAGIRTVEKELGRVESAASSAGSLIARAFTVTAILASAKALLDLSDAYVQIQNRLRVVTDDEAELADVTERLLDVANRTRASFQATAELYSRVSLATRELGRSQAETLAFTETLNKAIILSGASAQEAGAGLIQLSQGLASDTLRGDELRSVLEQLPVVADVIAKSLGVTRGELRKLGQEGKINAEIVLDAFAKARQEIDEKFAKSVPTVAQAFTVLKNNAIDAAGGLQEANGAVANLILLFAEAVGGIDDTAEALIDFYKPLLALPLGQIQLLNTLLTETRELFTDLNSAIAITNEQTVHATERIAALEQAIENAREQLEREPDNAAALQSIEKLTAKIKVLQLESGILDERLVNNEETLARLQEALAADPGNTALAQKVEQLTAKIATLRGEIEQLPEIAGKVMPVPEELQAVIDALKRENELIALSNREREIQTTLEKTLAKLRKEGVSEAVLAANLKALETQIRANVALNEYVDVLQKIRGPQEEFDRGVQIITDLHKAGIINAEEHARALQELAGRFEEIADLTGTGVNLPAADEPFGPELPEIPEVPADLEPLPPFTPFVEEDTERLRILEGVYESIVGPLRDYEIALEALDQLQRDGRISAEQYSTALLQLQASAGALTNTLESGLSAGLAQAKLQLSDVSGAAQNLVVNGFQSAEDAIVSFVVTGEAGIAELVNSILADLTRLLIHQAFQALLGSFAGGGGGGAAPFNPFGALGGGLAEGGPVEPDKTFLVGEEGPELFTPQDAGQITPAGETASILSGAQKPPVVNVSAPPAAVNVYNVSDPNEVPAGIESPDGEQAVLNVLQRNRGRVRSLSR